MLSIDVSHAVSFLSLPYEAALRPRLERAAGWLQNGGGKGSDFIGWVTSMSRITQRCDSLGNISSPSMLGVSTYPRLPTRTISSMNRAGLSACSRTWLQIT